MAEEHLQHLMKLIEAKQVYTSYALLKKMPADTYIPGKQKIHDELKDTLIKGKALHAILQNSRNNGDYPNALQQSLKLQEIVPDYPNLKHDISAIRTTLKNLHATISKAKIAASHGRKEEVIALLQTVRQVDAGHKEIALIKKTVRKQAQKKSAKSIILSVLILMVPCVLFGFEKIMIFQAKDHLQNATQHIQASRFKQANKDITKMSKQLRFVHVFTRTAKNDLLIRAASMQNSITFVQGMHGRVIHDGEFISEQKKDIIRQLEKLILDAAALTENSKWLETSEKYREALEFIHQHETHIGSEKQIIIAKMAELTHKQEEQAVQQATDECLAMIQPAHKAFSQKNWVQATEKYREAFDFANRLKVNETCIGAQSRSEYNSATMATFLKKGDELMVEDKPSEAVDYFQQALALATTEDKDEATIQKIQLRIDGLKDQVFMARVHLLIRKGDSLIQQGRFTPGLSKYNFALTMLESNSALIQDKEKLKAALIIKTKQTEKTAAITAQTAELQTAAESNLRKYFELPPQDKLEKVTIVLTDHQENLFTYRISAKSIRDKVKYELLYQFDENTATWKMLK